MTLTPLINIEGRRVGGVEKKLSLSLRTLWIEQHKIFDDGSKFSEMNVRGLHSMCETLVETARILAEFTRIVS